MATVKIKVITAITVKFHDAGLPETYKATGWGTCIDDPPRLWLDEAGGRFYILLDRVDWYHIGPTTQQLEEEGTEK